MKAYFSDLTKEQQATFGNGCSYVPDLIFCDICREHDFDYTRGGDFRDKLLADFTLLYKTVNRARAWEKHQFKYMLAGVGYYLGCLLLPISYIKFNWGIPLTLEEIIAEDIRINYKQLPQENH
jgi:hypothetical protein